MHKIHEVESKGVKDKILELVVDGRTHQIDLAKESKKLATATPAQTEDFIISPSGYGIHWPQIDEDLSIDPMIGLQHEIRSGKVAEAPPTYKNTEPEE